MSPNTTPSAPSSRAVLSEWASAAAGVETVAAAEVLSVPLDMLSASLSDGSPTDAMETRDTSGGAATAEIPSWQRVIRQAQRGTPKSVISIRPKPRSQTAPAVRVAECGAGSDISTILLG